MDIVEEPVVLAPPSHINNHLSPLAKRKRTNRRTRPYSPVPFSVDDRRLSPALSAADEEEEETARCLILLSQGTFLRTHDDHQRCDSSSKENITAERGGGTYACKTCDRVFSSFQALGGHRTSHTKPKNDKRTPLFPDFDDDFPPPSSKKRIPPSLSLQLSSGGGGRQLPSPRIHECSYCGAEFSSGQALGGHMRRHRAGPTSPLPSTAGAGVAETKPPEPKKARNRVPLDLNFPAPEDENQRFGYGGRRVEKISDNLVISAITPTLVD